MRLMSRSLPLDASCTSARPSPSKGVLVAAREAEANFIGAIGGGVAEVQPRVDAGVWRAVLAEPPAVEQVVETRLIRVELHGSSPWQRASCARKGMLLVSADTLRVVLDPRALFASEATVKVRVRASTRGGAHALDATYAFRVEDRTAPRLVGAQSIAPNLDRLGFSLATWSGTSSSASSRRTLTSSP